jgi:hypothetical protein
VHGVRVGQWRSVRAQFTRGVWESAAAPALAINLRWGFDQTPLFQNRTIAMRFSIGFVVGLLIGIAATAAYYELVGSEPNEITEPAKSGTND